MKAQVNDSVLVEAQIAGYPARPGKVLESLVEGVLVAFDDGTAPLWCEWSEVSKV